jgi:hypothetical protein
MGVAAVSGADRVSHLARRHGMSYKFVCAQRERTRQEVDHLPYYRLEQINAHSGVVTPRSTLAS